MKQMKGLVLAKMIRDMKVMSVDKFYHVGTKIMIHFKAIQDTCVDILYSFGYRN